MCGNWWSTGMSWWGMGGSFWAFLLLVIVALGALWAVNRSQHSK
ncbi:hypothetical protein [Lactiplantibacillus daowaiensis]|uniref:Uncharacterized protein n=1 Tax=Lactiplantibacillus daowaiensis TaxID=2559918 RepID=A0ABW1S352_9LACO|nr:hypothetical protein [Lactiplantibacillus daowaiensis]